MAKETQNAQEYVNQNYPDKTVNGINISNQQLTGSLDLREYPELKWITCHDNQLTSLDLSNCFKVERIDCYNNQLTDFNFLTTLPCPERLTFLALSGNPFSPQTLDCLTKLINLEYLDLENTNLEGSLAPLSQLTKLDKLYISNNRLGSDLEYLPANLKDILANGMPEVEEKMKDFGRNYQAWRKVNLWKVVQTYSLEQKQELTELDLSNQQTPNNNLEFLSDFIKLEYLNLSNNSFSGSLQFLQDLTKLKQLDISQTNLDSGLDFLPDSLEKLYCSGKIAQKLRSYGEPEKNNFAKLLPLWKDDLDNRITKQNDMIAAVISLERLFIIRGNLKQFLTKWGEKPQNNALTRLFGTNYTNELDKLSRPEEIATHWYWNFPQWGSKITAGIGGVLAITYEPATIGGSIAAISPVVDVITTKMKESFYDEKEKKWQEFLTDADAFLDSFNGLLGILSPIETGDLKINNEHKDAVSAAFKRLDERVKSFLNLFDDNQDYEISVSELINKRKILIRDLSKDNKGELQRIINDIKFLEKTIIDSRKLAYYGTTKNSDYLMEEGQLELSGEQIKQQFELLQKQAIDLKKQNQAQKQQIQALSQTKSPSLEREIREIEEVQEELQALQVQLPYGTASS